MPKRKTHLEYVQDVKRVHGGKLIVTEIYVGSQVKIEHKCTICGYIWKTRPASVIRGCGCPRCGDALLKTSLEYKEQVYKAHAGKILILENYINSKTKIMHKCTVCNHVWLTLPYSVIKSGCPKCNILCSAIKRTKLHSEYEQQITEVHNGRLLVVGIYKNATIKMKHKCLLCDYEWLAIPRNVLNGSGCPKCKINTLKQVFTKSHNIYVDQVRTLHDEKILVLGKYINDKTKIEHKCIRCNNVWLVVPGSILGGRGCPKCNNTSYSKSALDWMVLLEDIIEKKLQTAKDGEKIIYYNDSHFKLDGYTEIHGIKIAFEFYGDHYHGNPWLFTKKQKCHPFSSKTAKSLLKETRDREYKLFLLGINIVYIWEMDYRKIQSFMKGNLSELHKIGTCIIFDIEKQGGFTKWATKFFEVEYR